MAQRLLMPVQLKRLMSRMDWALRISDLSDVCKLSCAHQEEWTSVCCEQYALQRSSESTQSESIIATKPKPAFSGTVEIEAQVSAFGKVY